MMTRKAIVNIFSSYNNILMTATDLTGAETITNGAPASRCCAALSRSVKIPVDSITKSTSWSFQGSLAGSFSENILMDFPSIAISSLVEVTF